MYLKTKKDFQELMSEILDPLKSRYSANCSRLNLDGAGATYPQNIIEMESFARPLWALVPFWLGGGIEEEFEQIYRKGLINGTDPTSSEYWGGFHNKDQRFVEMAAIATGLMFCSDKLFDPLTDSEKDNLENWLYEINNYELPENNWLFFRVLVNTALKKRNLSYNKEQMEKDFEAIETYYIADGWYKDGISEHRDYYVSFAMHYYGLIYSQIMKNDDPIRSKLFVDRAEIFAHDFIYYFANNGAAVPYGRSLTYRFAQCAFFGAYLFAGLETIDLGVIKGVISRHFEYWFNQEMFDNSGVLTVGYCYQNLIMSERYNAPGSPFWAMKSFLFLALPDTHKFWEAESKPLPKLDKVKCLEHANMIIQRLNGGDNVIAYLPAELELYGHGHIIEKYSKFAYSTSFGFSVMRSAFCLEEACPDSMLAFVIDDTVFVRKVSKEYKVYENKIVSKWSPFIGIDITTTITITDTGHIRHHLINSEFDCKAYDFGFALPKFSDNYKQNISDDLVSVESEKLLCEVKSCSEGGQPMVLDCFPNTNLLFKNTVIPGISYKINKGESVLDTEITAWVN